MKIQGERQLHEENPEEFDKQLHEAINNVVDAAEMAHWVAFDWGDLGYRPIGMLNCVADAIRRESGRNADSTAPV